MAKGLKGVKFAKIKSVLKKMQSFKLSRTNSIAARHSFSDDDLFDSASSAKDLHPVFVGKSRRKYLVSDDVIYSPLFREIVERRSGGGDCVEEDAIVVGCEVVLFEHLLWMLENADPQAKSLCELAEFYTC